MLILLLICPSFSLTNDEIEHFQKCLAPVKTPITNTTFQMGSMTDKNHNAASLVFTSGTNPIQNITSDIDALSKCVTSLYPMNFMDRSHAFGNTVIWLNEVLPHFLPEIWAEVYGKALQMNQLGVQKFGWKSMEQHSVRTIEYLDYREGSSPLEDKYGLGIDFQVDVHDDNGSTFTMVYCLEDDYEGGEFFTFDDGNKLVGKVKLKKGESLLIESETKHAVGKIKGKRKVLCIEFWDKPPSKLTDGRNSWKRYDHLGNHYFADGDEEWRQVNVGNLGYQEL